MEVDKSILLQKQVRNNSEDLQSEFLDMKNWEEQMKKADTAIRNADGDQSLPPVRRKKKSSKSIQKPKNAPNAVKSKRIVSSDYSSWDKFDVDKACREVDDENKSDETAEEPLSKAELEKNHTEATKHKTMGNLFVQKQQWIKAIACYNEAIKLFPYDAVFYANRALCYLKIDNLYSAEADCTAAVQLDECYVKAYHRRATARIELKQYREAAEDIKRVLKLEPSNKEAKSLLARVNKSIDNEKPLIISSVREKVEDMPIEKKIGEKLCGKIASEKIKDPEKKKNVEEKFLSPSDEKIITDSAKPMEIELNSELPEWLPEVQEDVGIVKVMTKPPHQRSKKPLRTVSIEEMEFGAKKQSVIDPIIESSDAPSRSVGEPEDPSIRLTGTEVASDNVPVAPKTAVQFLMTWRKNKSSAFRYKYLKQIPAERIPTLFQDSMESDTFSEIVNVLRSEFTSRNESVSHYLKHLSAVKRFRTLTMFMSGKDKENLKTLFVYIKNVENQSEDVVAELGNKYEM